jgi:SMI1 / KNR4 family (SUKH-1)
MNLHHLAHILSRMASSQIATAADLAGCSDAEISLLEAKYQIQLPRTYKEYLQVMGHQSGRLFTFDHMAVFYQYVLSMTGDLKQEWIAENVPPENFLLPADALIISGRLGEQFEFIRCAGGLDSPVWYFNTWQWKIKESQASLNSWLELWCGEAERAIASGYFDQHPNGTRP